MNDLLARARSIFQSIVDGAYLDDNRDRVADVREWELKNIEKWLEDYGKAEQTGD
jgi:hypothetical protein